MLIDRLQLDEYEATITVYTFKNGFEQRWAAFPFAVLRVSARRATEALEQLNAALGRIAQTMRELEQSDPHGTLPRIAPTTPKPPVLPL